jgi:hypothetical protein
MEGLPKAVAGSNCSVIAPRAGENNIAVDVILDRANAYIVLAAEDRHSTPRLGIQDVESKVSGHIAISGIPKAMVGAADLQLSALAGEPFQSISARATFSGANVNLENLDARLDAGHVTAKGTFNTETHLADLSVTGQSLQLSRLAALTGVPALQTATGTADLTAHIAAGNLLDKDFFVPDHV